VALQVKPTLLRAPRCVGRAQECWVAMKSRGFEQQLVYVCVCQTVSACVSEALTAHGLSSCCPNLAVAAQIAGCRSSSCNHAQSGQHVMVESACTCNRRPHYLSGCIAVGWHCCEAHCSYNGICCCVMLQGQCEGRCCIEHVRCKKSLSTLTACGSCACTQPFTLREAHWHTCVHSASFESHCDQATMFRLLTDV
jgi:hypothetical protein